MHLSSGSGSIQDKLMALQGNQRSFKELCTEIRFAPPRRDALLRIERKRGETQHAHFNDSCDFFRFLHNYPTIDAFSANQLRKNTNKTPWHIAVVATLPYQCMHAYLALPYRTVPCLTLPCHTLPCLALSYLTLLNLGTPWVAQQKGKTKRFATNLWYVNRNGYRVQKTEESPPSSPSQFRDLIAFFSARARCEFQLCFDSAGGSLARRGNTRAVIGSIGWLDQRSNERSIDRFANCAATVSNASLRCKPF